MKVINTVRPIVKHEEMVAEFDHLTPRMRMIVLFVDDFIYRRFNARGIWTSFFRLDDKKSCHYYGRGCDLSDRIISLNGSVGIRNMTKQEINTLVSTVNKHFPYGKGKYKTALHHKVAQSAYHTHLQVKAI